jgi:signal transduction histidine kinase
MADRTPPLTSSSEPVSFDSDRVAALLQTLERLASGQVDLRLPVSPRHDALDAIAHGINTLVGELEWAHARYREAQEAQAEELRVTAVNAQARSDALLRAIPDLMFVLRRDGTYLDYHVRDHGLLFAPPDAFLGRKVTEIFPPALAGVMMVALERAAASGAIVVVEYELPMDEPRFYEARIVRVDADRLLSIVRDVTESKRASEINRDLARRLLSRQEDEWQRIARELHDDISQRLALLNVELDASATEPDAEALRMRLRRLSSQVGEIARDVHDLSYELHPSRLRSLGLVTSLRTLCEDTSSWRNLHVVFSHGDMPAVDPAVSLCLFRIVQEALHNVVRHSQAHSAQVTVQCDEREITLEIADSGIGFDPARVQHAGLGLVSMRERVAIVNGELAIDAAPGGGTRVTVRIPLNLRLDPHSVSSPTMA